MATILKCKMCGGDIEVSQDMTVGKCLFCGSIVTLPKIDTEKKVRLFNRANQYRLNCEFDKAYSVYQAIAQEDEQEAEAYWGMILSEYGVEYVEDAETKKRIPTCHRTHMASIRSTVNYEMACKYATSENRFIYEDEAEEIDRIQKEILAISSKEDPYDVFICYKETDDMTGERTRDSVIAHEIYTELEKQGIKAFFSRITLADKLGKDYEPYIYSALYSAKVMLVVCTSNHNVNGVWVKNEWSRFLRFMQDDSGKILIPAYKDMAVYELPDELTKFQAQDLSKIGAIQDLVYSIKKVVSFENREKKDHVLEELIQEKIQRENIATEKKIKRKKRVAITKRVLLGIGICVVLLGMGAGGVKLYKEVLYPNSIYKDATELMDSGEYAEAIQLFRDLNGYKDSSNYITECHYLQACTYLENKNYEEAIAAFESLEGYKDAKEMIKLCRYNIASDASSKGDYETAIDIFLSLEDFKDAKNCAVNNLVKLQLTQDKFVAKIGDVLGQMSDEQLYQVGTYLFDKGDYSNCVSVMKNCLKYEDSLEFCKESYYQMAFLSGVKETTIYNLYDLASGKTLGDIDSSLGDLAKSEKAQVALEEMIEVEELYLKGVSKYNDKKWVSAKEALKFVAMVNYKDAATLLKECESNIALELLPYGGIWLPSDGENFRKKIKIEGTQMWYSYQSDEKWIAMHSVQYNENEDIGKMSFKKDINSDWCKVIVNGDDLIIEDEAGVSVYYYRAN